jgi:hypothetical protein
MPQLVVVDLVHHMQGERSKTHRRRRVRTAVRRQGVEEAALVAAKDDLAQPPADQLAVPERDVPGVDWLVGWLVGRLVG